MTRFDVNSIITKKKHGTNQAHLGAHQYELLITPRGLNQYICTLPKCTHSLNIDRWIVGKENLCSSCLNSHIVEEDKVLLCQDCKSE